MANKSNNLHKTQKTRIIFSIPSAVVGGIENHLSRQLRLFSSDEYEVSVILLFAKSKITLKDILPSHVTVYDFAFKNIYDVPNVKKLYRLLKKLQPHIVVTSAFDANTLFRVLAPFVGYTCVPRLHNLYLTQPLHLRIIDSVFARFSPTIVAVSSGVADYASKRTWIPRKNFTVIPNGIDINETQVYAKKHPDTKKLRQELGFDLDAKIILVVGRLKPQKNIGLAIDAFANFVLNTNDTKHMLVIVGDGGDIEMLKERAATYGLSGRIIFTGLKRDTFGYYHIADMFLMTSIREGFPNVLLESMAFGVPFISTRVPGATEAIQDSYNGFLADSTPDALAEKIAIIADSSPEEKARYRANCLATAQKYSMEENVGSYKELFSRLLKK
ncbi:MAG: glycosyltransferase [bacterium]|nr:glycosyltransferase [bacterium]